MVERAIGINGAGGEIGRNLLRINAIRKSEGEPTLPITHLVEGYLSRDQFIEVLQNDPVRGAFPGVVTATGNDGVYIDGEEMQFLQVPTSDVPEWGAMGVWGVMEATGARVDEKLAQEHLGSGAHKVLVTAPTKGNKIAKTLIMGFNESTYDPDKHHVLTNESCTTKSAIHPAKALQDEFGLRAISLATIHAETGGEKRSLISRSGRVDDLSTLGFTPQSTGSQGALTKVFPHVDVRAEAYRVPVTDGSISDITFKLDKRTTQRKAEVALSNALSPGIWQIVDSIRNSAELIGNRHDAVVPHDKIFVIDHTLVRVVSGYDNAYGPADAAIRAMDYVRR